MADRIGIPASRRRVVEWAQRSGCGDAPLRSIALLTTEAVTNAVRHGPSEGEVTVVATMSDDGWRVAVSDQGTAVPVVRRVAPLSVGGRGMLLIDRLASAWGVENHGTTGKTVWFHVARGTED
jgi:anti-sigma regulatory factor (Ser/Thr protein kinase)